VLVTVVAFAGACGSAAGMRGAGQDHGGTPTKLTAAAAGTLLGDSATETGRGSLGPGEAIAVPVTALSSGTVGEVHIFAGAGSAARGLRVGLYTDAAGHPGGLLAAAPPMHVRPEHWITLPLTASVRRGRRYWLAVLARGGSFHYRYRRGSACRGARSVRRGVTVLPKSWRGSGLSARCRVSAYATSAPGRTVTAAPAGCINSLGACGYPDPSTTNVGPGVACSSLTPAGEMRITRAGTTIANMNITGGVAIDANNVTLTHDCVSNEGQSTVDVERGVTGAKIEYSDVSGVNTTSDPVEEAISTNQASGTTADHDYLYNCGECFHGPGILTNSYVIANASINPGQSNEDHYEGIYYGGGGGPLVVEHDTIIDPHDQTAAIFVSHDFGDVTTLTIKNNILEGGDYVIYGGGSGNEGRVVGPVTVTGNRFSTRNYAEGAQYGPEQYFNEAVTTWSGNIWDDTLAPVPLAG
jgi:hypothetical protein